MKSSIFQISNSKIWRISALKVYLQLNQKAARITLTKYDKPSLNMQKQIWANCPISIDFNLKTFRAEILQIFELLICKIDDFINSFWLYLSFTRHDFSRCQTRTFEQSWGWIWRRIWYFSPVPSHDIHKKIMTKGQTKSEWIYDVIDFLNYQPKNLKDFCPENLKSGRIKNIKALYYVK